MKRKHNKKIIWYPGIYIGETARPKRYEIVHKIKAGKILYDVYVIMLPLGEHNQLEIINANQLLAPWYRKSMIRIAGIAKGYDEAVELLSAMFEDAFRKIGEYNPRCMIEQELLQRMVKKKDRN